MMWGCVIVDIGIGISRVDHKCVVKGYEEVSRLTGVRLLEECSLTSPVFLIDMGRVDIDVFSNINYLHWFKMKRFYYVNDITFTGGLVNIHCTLDCRRTWMNTIRNSTQYVDRQEKKYNKMLFDNELPLQSDKNKNVYVWNKNVGDSTKTSRNYVLITNGKVEET